MGSNGHYKQQAENRTDLQAPGHAADHVKEDTATLRLYQI